MGNSSVDVADAGGLKTRGPPSSGPKLSKLAAIGNSKYLGLYLLAPAFLFVGTSKNAV